MLGFIKYTNLFCFWTDTGEGGKTFGKNIDESHGNPTYENPIVLSDLKRLAYQIHQPKYLLNP
jgi:hypothetical protein